jgi:hypothetical protein
MSPVYKLDCRYCDNYREGFERKQEIKDSEWSNVSSLRVVSDDGVMVHKGYCPKHSVDGE